MLKLFAFDFDGTLCESSQMCIDVTKETMEKFLKKNLSDAEATKYFGLTEEGMLSLAVPEHKEEAIKLYYELFEKASAKTHLFDGSKDLLSYTRSLGLKTAIVTGKGRHTCMQVLEFFGLTPYFDIIQSGSDKIGGKYLTFLTLMERTGLKPEEIAYLGDATSDVEYCAKAHIPCLSAAWAKTSDPKVLEKANPGRVCLTMDDAKRMIAAMA